MKNILITGASAGFGKAIAEKLAVKGNRLILTGRTESKLKKITQYINEQTEATATPLVFDIQNLASCEIAIKSIPTEYLPIDVLINNAGLALETKRIDEGNISDWEQMINTNIKGLLYITRLISPQMVARKEGHIINIGSISSHEVYPGGNVYCATKHAVWALSQGMRLDFLPHGIKVTQVSPGAAETEFSIVRFKGDTQRASQVYEGFEPLYAEDVADVVAYVLSRPKHVCINEIHVTATAQYGGIIHRNK